MIIPIILLSICIALTTLFLILTSIEDFIFLIPTFIFGILSVALIIVIDDSEEVSNKEKPTREVDYSIILIPFDKVEITDKHGNRDTIQFESLQYFIEQDNK